MYFSLTNLSNSFNNFSTTSLFLLVDLRLRVSWNHSVGCHLCNDIFLHILRNTLRYREMSQRYHRWITIFRLTSRVESNDRKNAQAPKGTNRREGTSTNGGKLQAAEGIHRSIERERKKETESRKLSMGGGKWQWVGASGPPTEDREVPRRATAMHSRLRRYTSNHNVTNAS